MKACVSPLMTVAQRRAAVFLTHFAVVGMSSATGQYDTRYSAQYDAGATALLGAARAIGVSAESGAAELGGLELSDSVGHVRPNSSSIVFNAYKVWLQKCIGLAVPPPPPIELLPLPACPAVPATPGAHQHCFSVVFADGASLDVTCATACVSDVASAVLSALRMRPSQLKLVLIQGGLLLGLDAIADCTLPVTVVKMAPVPRPDVEEPWVARWNADPEAFFRAGRT